MDERIDDDEGPLFTQRHLLPQSKLSKGNIRKPDNYVKYSIANWQLYFSRDDNRLLSNAFTISGKML